MQNITLEQLVSFLKEQGFVFQGSEIYGGLANAWDYGPLGVELMNNIKQAWWKKFVKNNRYNVGLDSAILMNKEVWVASGHIGSFSDPLIDCKKCHARYRADKLVEDFTKGEMTGDGMSNEDLLKFIYDHKITCPSCGNLDYTDIRKFNLMFKTHQGVVEDNKSEVYLRPETAQGIFVNFKNVLRTSRKKLPFGIGQIGKSFRNEITPGNFIFRTREFEQMELEFFCKPGTELEWFQYWRSFCMEFLVKLGINRDKLRYRDHTQEELSFYSNGTTDIEYEFPWGFGELWGIASRTNYDLNAHQTHSKENLEYLDPETNEKYLPYVVEPSVGVGRILLSALFSAYDEEINDKNEKRIVLRLSPVLAPYKVAVLPLIKKLHADKANEIFDLYNEHFSSVYDETANIGKRYRRQDAIGTPFCVTVDDETLNSGTVTLRDRDSMEQITLQIEEVIPYIEDKLKF
ncbi:MAG: glycine--tRNA ligase [Anaeroplasmataceae bacterium]|jgi:glycyl-tRNA synthetase, dimeric type|nr:glycine--tRNA ligase [Anaeroplasmataceae bacterium]